MSKLNEHTLVCLLILALVCWKVNPGAVVISVNEGNGGKSKRKIEDMLCIYKKTTNKQKECKL